MAGKTATDRRIVDTALDKLPPVLSRAPFHITRWAGEHVPARGATVPNVVQLRSCDHLSRRYGHQIGGRAPHSAQYPQTN